MLYSPASQPLTLAGGGKGLVLLRIQFSIAGMQLQVRLLTAEQIVRSVAHAQPFNGLAVWHLTNVTC